MCIEYKVDDDLSKSIKVEVLDPVNEEKHIEVVKMTYLAKPMICAGCKSLGHFVGACHRVT